MPGNKSNSQFIVNAKNSASTSDQYREHARSYAGRYFVIRHHYLRELAGRLQMIAFLDSFFPKGEAGMNFTCDSTRLTTTFSVKLLAAFARLLFESGFFNDTSKLLVCRRFAGIFSTRCQKEISPRSFVNHFNLPDQPSLVQIAENLGKWMKIVEKLQSRENVI